MTSSLLFRSKHKYYKPQNIYICINFALIAPNLIAKYMCKHFENQVCHENYIADI